MIKPVEPQILKLGTLARRDFIALVSALAILVTVCWWYLVIMARDMARMAGMSSDMSATGVKPWTASDVWMMFAMWAIMMIAMMVPTAMRAVLIFTQISARQKLRGRPFVSGYWFASGYILAWTGFSAAATFLQWTLDQAAYLTPGMVIYSPLVGAGILLLAGAWQMTPMKDTCLKHCQSPLLYLAQNFRSGKIGALRLGLKHGLYCLGCCWALMGILFVAGVMNLAWILAIIPTSVAYNLCAQSRIPIDRMREGWFMSLFQASQQWVTMSS